MTLAEVQEEIKILEARLEKEKEFRGPWYPVDCARLNAVWDALAEARHKEALMQRADLETRHACHAGYVLSGAGADLEKIEPFTSELTSIVDTMKEQLATETRILEGTEVPVYKPLAQNELSFSETKEDQWNSVSPNGFSTIAHTLTLEPVSNTSPSFAELFNQDCPIQRSREKSQPAQTVFSEGKWDASGCETGAMDECSECTVPTISEPTLGTPNEAK